MTPIVRQIFVYPIKSLKGIALERTDLTDRGLAHDRRWMLVDHEGRFITQREHAELCFFDVTEEASGFRVTARAPLHHQRSVLIPWQLDRGPRIQVVIWSDTCEAIVAQEELNAIFSEALGRSCKLVYMPSETRRIVDVKYTNGESLSAFGDGYPVLLIGTASLDDLNQRLVAGGGAAIGWDRFRPNIVVQTESPFEEDYWKQFSIGGLSASGVKLFSRCVFTTINQITGEQSKEPLRTLAGYRAIGGKVMFGQNVVFEASIGQLKVGDEIKIEERGLPLNGVS